ncbi:hypothetical protein SE17_26895 [Kouleothrix aurantiaca]|uniref:Uncharacterized protein n=1 Tax=Kouleothrix aurantiaca TaxID=186479 RepID=A0A0P9FCJ1_9CHLR|nr:hypothetical protein SE17_26895 [Kouleothrix aurantiaca]
MTLRDFLFLDTQVISDYLSSLEGYIVEGPVEQTESGEKGADGKFDLKAVSAGAKLSKSTETKRKLAITDVAQFQQLYDLLEEQEELQYLEAFDEAIWNQLRRGEVLEIQAKIKLPKGLLITRDVENIAPLLDLMQFLGQDPLADQQAKTAFEGMRAVGKSIEDQPIPIIFEAVSTPRFTFVAHLPKKYIRRDLIELQGEATVFGKIQRVLPKGERLEVFSLVPSLTGATSINRQQRRKMQKNANDNQVTEEIKGPAIILNPVAVYR